MVIVQAIKKIINRSHLARTHPPIVFKKVIRHWNDYRTLLTTIPKLYSNPPYNLAVNDEVVVLIIPTGKKTDTYKIKTKESDKNVQSRD